MEVENTIQNVNVILNRIFDEHLSKFKRTKKVAPTEKKMINFHDDLTLKNKETGQIVKLSKLNDFFKKMNDGFEGEFESFFYDSRFGDGEIIIKGLEGRWWYSITKLKKYKELKYESGSDEWEFEEHIYSFNYYS
jgi:hypothetical protein